MACGGFGCPLWKEKEGVPIMGRVSRVAAVLAAVGMLFSGGRDGFRG